MIMDFIANEILYYDRKVPMILKIIKRNASIFKLFSFLDRVVKFQAFLLFIIICLSAFSDLLSVVLMSAYLNVLLGLPSILEMGEVAFSNQRLLIFLMENLGLVTGLVLLAALMLKLSVIVCTQFVSARIGTHFALLIFKSYHQREFVTIENEPASEITSILTNKVTSISTGTFFPLFNMLGNATTLLVLMIATLWANFALTISLLIVVIFCYTLIYFLSSDLKKVESLRIAKGVSYLAQLAQNSHRFASHLKKAPAAQYFLSKLEEADKTVRAAQAKLLILASSPRYVLEAAVLISVLVFFSNSQGQLNSDILSNVIFVAIALQRLLPAVQQIYSNVTVIASHRASVDDVLAIVSDVESLVMEKVEQLQLNCRPSELSIRGLRHPSIINGQVLNTVDIRFPSWTLIDGASGAGKSTLLKIIAGLYKSEEVYYSESGYAIKPDVGDCVISPLDCVHAELQGQDVTDGSLVENLYFTTHLSPDKVKIHKALEIVELDTKFEGKFDIGTKKLSGGEKQRLAICRALICESPVVILDEITSGLDNKLERRIFKKIKKQYPDRSFIVVSHGTPNSDLFDQIISLKVKENKNA